MGLGSISAALAWRGALVPPNEVPASSLSAPCTAKRKYQPLRQQQLCVGELVFDPFLLHKTAQWVVN